MTTPDDTTGKRANDMSKPEDIPQDVWDSALEHWLKQGDWTGAELLAHAILAERERCANVAEGHGAARKQQYLGATSHKAHKDARDYQSMSMSAYQVAADIRRSTP